MCLGELLPEGALGILVLFEASCVARHGTASTTFRFAGVEQLVLAFCARQEKLASYKWLCKYLFSQPVSKRDRRSQVRRDAGGVLFTSLV